METSDLPNQIFKQEDPQIENEKDLSNNEKNDLDNTSSTTPSESNKDSNNKSNQSESSESTNNRKRLNKKEKKYLKYKQLVENYRLKKEKNKELKRLSKEATSTEVEEQTPPKPKSNIFYEVYYNKRELKKLINERLEKIYEDNSDCLKICIDCSFSNRMSDKELSRLAQQIGRCYATNKSIKSPVHLTLCNLDKESKFYTELVRVNDGFANYKIFKSEKTLEELYSSNLESLCYLSPDSKTYLEDLNSTNTYVIGGLVDETVSKQVTLSKCNKLKINSFSLPIEKYMTRKLGGINGRTFNYNKILAINQVFDILANYYMNRDWPKALQSGIPPRKGFEPMKQEEQTDMKKNEINTNHVNETESD